MNCKDLIGRTINYNGKKLKIVSVTVDVLGVWVELEDGRTIKYEEDE